MRPKFKHSLIMATTAIIMLGGSLTSLAAQKGQWHFYNGDWYCYDSEGLPFESQFCFSGVKEYYVDDNGKLAHSSWIEYNDELYYVNSAGEKVCNEWRYLDPFEEPYNDKEWYYFQSNGKMAASKKLHLGNNTYYFNSDGAMLTGWVKAVGDTFDNTSVNDVLDESIIYCDDSGARINNSWVYTYSIGEDLDDVDDMDKHWFYLQSNGTPSVGKVANIDGNTYFFDPMGEMLSGWVAGSDDNYFEIWDSEDTGTAVSSVVKRGMDVYFCGSPWDGHAKKGRWIKEFNSVTYGEQDPDNDKHWFYLLANGKLYVPATSSNASMSIGTSYSLIDAYTEPSRMFSEISTAKVKEKKIDHDTYLFNDEGEMLSGFVKMNDCMYYYGDSDDGAKKTGSITVIDENGEAAKAYLSKKSISGGGYYPEAGVVGAWKGKLYAYGVLVKANEEKYEKKTVNGMTFIVDKHGNIQTKTVPYLDNGEILFSGNVFTYDTETDWAGYGKIR